MFIVTGGAGFIGSNIIKHLNLLGIANILVVDSVQNVEKMNNIIDCEFIDLISKEDFIKKIKKQRYFGVIEGISHQGACSNTMEQDGIYMMENNYYYTKYLINYAVKRGIPLVYASSASVYGNLQLRDKSDKNNNPLNLYAFSKFMIDKYVNRMLDDIQSTLVGLRYYNVYGLREMHKQNMASSIFQFYNELNETGKIKLFQSIGNYKNGEEKRDFVYVEDIVDVNLFFLLNKELKKGIYDVGSGIARSYNEIANKLIELKGKGTIEYIDFPEKLKSKYQFFTQANINQLKSVGYDKGFTKIEDGIEKYVNALDRR